MNPVAVEVRRVDDNRLRWVGVLDFNTSIMDIVMFDTDNPPGSIISIPDVCVVSKSSRVSKGVHKIVCVNVMGTEYSGTLDCLDFTSPSVSFTKSSGHTIRNLSKEGYEWSRKNIPNVFLGYHSP